jgi:hypothetical protein
MARHPDGGLPWPAGRFQRARRPCTVRVQASSLVLSPGRWLGPQTGKAVEVEPAGKPQYGVELTADEWSPYFDPLNLSPGMMQVARARMGHS